MAQKVLEYYVVADSDGNFEVNTDAEVAMDELDTDLPVHVYAVRMSVTLPEVEFPVEIDARGVTPTSGEVTDIQVTAQRQE